MGKARVFVGPQEVEIIEIVSSQTHIKGRLTLFGLAFNRDQVSGSVDFPTRMT